MLAKELATIDVLSGGRLELGLGAGWMKSDYDQSGIPMDPPGVRVDRMEEGIAVHQGLLRRRARSPSRASTTRSPSYDGLPKPVAVAARRSSSAAAPSGCCRSPAREADIVGINPSIHSGQVDAAAAQNGAAGETDQKLAVGEGGRRRPLRRPRDQHAAVRRRSSPTTARAPPR